MADTRTASGVDATGRPDNPDEKTLQKWRRMTEYVITIPTPPQNSACVEKAREWLRQANPTNAELIARYLHVRIMCGIVDGWLQDKIRRIASHDDVKHETVVDIVAHTLVRTWRTAYLIDFTSACLKPEGNISTDTVGRRFIDTMMELGSVHEMHIDEAGDGGRIRCPVDQSAVTRTEACKIVAMKFDHPRDYKKNCHASDEEHPDFKSSSEARDHYVWDEEQQVFKSSPYRQILAAKYMTPAFAFVFLTKVDYTASGKAASTIKSMCTVRGMTFEDADVTYLSSMLRKADNGKWFHAWTTDMRMATDALKVFAAIEAPGEIIGHLDRVPHFTARKRRKTTK